MKLPDLAFTATEWSSVPATIHPGERGEARWRSFEAGDLRVRMVEYSPAISPTIGATAAMCCSCSTASC